MATDLPSKDQDLSLAHTRRLLWAMQQPGEAIGVLGGECDRQQTKIVQLMFDIETLRAELAKERAAYSRSFEAVVEAERLRVALAKYGHHTHPNCHDLTLNADGSFGPRNGCLCGFESETFSNSGEKE